jgi:hydrogenase expression/formation protein HypE
VVVIIYATDESILPMKNDKILLDHGSGGKISHDFVAETLVPLFDNPILSQLHDGAVLTINGTRLAFSTDSYVVDPIFFPGGDIGDLAVNGTVNDLAMCGAIPRYLSAGFIIEEGFLMTDLKRILKSMKAAAVKAGVEIVTGDTKVVHKGAADKIFINTAGIGAIPETVHISGDRAKPGDRIILSGTLADHGMTILNQRENLSFHSAVASDSAALNHLVAKMLAVCPDIHVLRDPTRGGLGTALNEIAESSRAGIRIQEAAIPVKSEVAGMCELLGIDPLYVANEGKLFAVVPEVSAEAVLDTMKQDPLGADAAIIGEVVADHPGKVYMKTRIGGTRIVQMLAGDQLPRIC